MKIFLTLAVSIAAFCTTLNAGNFQVNKAASEILVDSRATPPHTVTSYVREYNCDIQINPESLKVSDAQFSFNLSDLDSEHEKRDKKMHTWIDSEHFPTISFSLSDVSEVDGQLIGKGALNMHGVSKAIEVPFTVSKNDGGIQLDGSATFSYEDWDLEIIRLFLFRVRPELNVRFHLEGTLRG